MSVHAFDPKIAEKVGLNAAVIYHNILFWCAKNLANERNVHDGVAWTYNSTQAFQRQFPYLSADQIRHALSKLEDEGLIRVGNFNQSPMDRTKWYSAVGQMDLGYFPDAIRNNPEAIPDSKPDNKPDEKCAREELSLFSEIQPESQAERSGTAKKQKEDPIEVVLRSRLSKQAASDFIAHRKALKKPLTARAAELVIAKLDGCADPDAVVNASIMNGWQGVFPERAVPAPTAPPAYKPRERWYEVER